MDRPVHEIGGVITALCTGSKDEQAKTLNKYFTPDVSFVHPFCRVPSFSGLAVPLINTKLDSRWFVKMVYQWYRILSPHIDVHIHSITFDQRNNLLYLTIFQTFTIWFVPFSLWQANVKLVSVLKLDALPEDENGQAIIDPHAIAPGDRSIATRYFIRAQEDYYQVNEFLKFIAPWGASLLWFSWQIFATFLSMLGVACLWPVTTVHDYLTKNAPQWGKITPKKQ